MSGMSPSLSDTMVFTMGGENDEPVEDKSKTDGSSRILACPTVNADAKEHKMELSMRPARPMVKYPMFVTNVLAADVGGRCVCLWLLVQRYMAPSCVDKYGSSCDLLGRVPLTLILLEMAVGVLVLNKFCRWEEQGHMITLWQVMSAAMIMTIRRSLYVEPALFVIAVLMLYSTYFVGLMAEFREDTEIRVPPFCPKSEDVNRPKHGWLGANMANMVQWKPLRVVICCVLQLSSFSRTITIFYFGAISVEDDLRGLMGNLDALFWANVLAAIIGLFPNFLVQFCTWPDLFKDFVKMKRSTNVYRTGPYEMCSLDDDLRKDSALSEKLKNHNCQSLTVLLPCYMPNEEDILMSILQFYRERSNEYPGEFRVMVVWNSPRDHPEMEEQLQQLMQEWPSLSSYRNHDSTSKCDNLNMAIGLLETEMALLNDADTLVSAATMCRASINIFEGKVDIAQSHNIHCWDDFIGRPEDSCFTFGAAITLGDSTKPLNQSVQGFFKHSPFNGRGGFWRTSALKLVGFDHRSIGEDHDAAYRGFAYYGLKGVLDPNMLCMEREPPNCKALTNQRTRWETAALQMRRTFPWVLRSKHYSRFEAFLLIWSQVAWNQMPLQQMPLQICQMLPLAVAKGFLRNRVFGDQDASLRHVFGDQHSIFRSMCENDDCIGTLVINGQEIHLPIAFIIFAAVFLVIPLLCIMDLLVRTALTRYRPRAAFCLFNAFVGPIIMLPFQAYTQFWALYDYCWGNAKFICTMRTSSSEVNTV
jgi:hypothetical protein